MALGRDKTVAIEDAYLKELVDEDLAFVEEVERTTLLESMGMSSPLIE